MTLLNDPQARPLVDEIRNRQLEWARKQLVSPEAEATFREGLKFGWEALLAKPIAELVNPAALDESLDRILEPKLVREATAPIGRALRAWLLGQLQADEAFVGDYVPEAARTWIDGLISRSAPVRTRITKVVVEHETTEALMRDVLHDALTDFSNKVNPFFAEWGLPALLKRVMPLGSGAVLRSMESMKAEFDKRLEPEIRRFLQGASRQALRKLSGMLTNSEETPQAIALRAAIFEAILEQKVSELGAELGEEGFVLAQGVGDEVVAHFLSLDSIRTRRRAALEAFVEAHGGATLGEVLAQYEIGWVPDLDALATALWPVIESALASEPVQKLLDGWINRFFDEIAP